MLVSGTRAARRCEKRLSVKARRAAAEGLLTGSTRRTRGGVCKSRVFPGPARHARRAVARGVPGQAPDTGTLCTRLGGLGRRARCHGVPCVDRGDLGGRQRAV